MKNRKFTSLIMAAAAVLLIFASVTPALAAAPQVETFHDEFSFVAADCGNFLALEDAVSDVRITTFFDDAGNPIKAELFVNFNGTLTNSVTGQTLRDPGRIRKFFDLQTGAASTVGLIYAITVPREGVAILEAGKISFDADGNVTFSSGPKDFFEQGEALICAALE